MRRDPEGVIRPEAQRFRRRLGWVMALGILPVLGTLLALGIGCGVQTPRLGPGSDVSGEFRWAADDTARMLRNVQYFKLMGQPELGLKELEEAHRLDPGNLHVADALAHCYDEVGMGARAQQIYLETLAQAPDNPALENNLCFSYYQAGDLSQAETCYRKALDRQPQNQAARNNLGLVLCRQGRQDEARRLWQETEVEAVASKKLAEVLATLGMTGEIPYAQPTRLHPGGKPGLHPSQPEPWLAAKTLTAAPGPHPAQVSLPAVGQETETAVRPTPAPSVAAPEKVAATLPAKQPEPDSRSRELAASRQGKDQVSQAARVAPQPGAGLVSEPLPLRPLPPRREIAAAPAPQSPGGPNTTAARPEKTRAQPAIASQSVPKAAVDKPALATSRGNSRRPITARELMETNIAILNGNGIQDLARETRSQLCLEGYCVVSINNFRDFGVGRTIIYHRPDSKHVAAILNEKFFPGAELESTPQLTDNIDVKVVLGHDLCPQPRAEVPQAHKPRL
jgi:Tetratricopeptide repeat/LytR cell envelope-related transcriptional attenuator